MRWKRFTIDTTCEAVDLLCDALMEAGVEGVEIEDNVPLTEAEKKGMFIDLLPELPPDNGKASVSFYIEEKESGDDLLAKVQNSMEELRLFCDPGPCHIQQSLTEDKDWINNWKEFFKPFTVDDILIKPTWEAVPPEHADKLMIEIDPGTAFGTGTHETTQLCIRALEKYIKPGDTVLDIGTGSGILGIAAIKLGASQVLGTDLDEYAVAAARENIRVNDIDAGAFPVITGNIIDDQSIQETAGSGCYDVVVANILAPVIILLQRCVCRHMKPGAVFIASGIINTKESEVIAALKENPLLEILEVSRQNDWVGIAAKRIT